MTGTTRTTASREEDETSSPGAGGARSPTKKRRGAELSGDELKKALYEKAIQTKMKKDKLSHEQALQALKDDLRNKIYNVVRSPSSGIPALGIPKIYGSRCLTVNVSTHFGDPEVACQSTSLFGDPENMT